MSAIVRSFDGTSTPSAAPVRWLHGDATNLPELHVDLATMTANVAHVFLTDEELSATLRGIHGALRPGGHLVFETRDPGQRPWLRWNRDATYQRLEVPGGGSVETWWDLTEVKGDCVSYRRTVRSRKEHVDGRGPVSCPDCRVLLMGPWLTCRLPMFGS